MSRALQARQVIQALKRMAGEPQSLSLNELRVIVALERAIARLEAHPRLAEHLIFKGGFVLLKTIESTRFTRDVDALAIGITRERVPEMIERALKLDLDDGLWFGDLKTEDLPDQGSYGGYRFNCAFQIGDPPAGSGAKDKIKKFSRIHIDVGFGDVVEGILTQTQMVSVLPDRNPVSWRIYPLEFIFAEKLQALFSRGSGSSRAKDIHDLPLIFDQCPDLEKLKSAVTRTFRHRETELPASLEGTARSFDPSLLRSAWGSVELSTGVSSFEEWWERLLNCLERIDGP